MQIIVNGENIEVSNGCNSVAALLAHMDIHAVGVAVAIEKSVITRSRWSENIITEGCKVTIIRATQGG